MIKLILILLSLNSFGAVVSIKDPNEDNQMTVNSDGSINVNGGGGGGGTVNQGNPGTQPWPVTTVPVISSSPVISNVSATANVSVTLLVLNSNRKGATIFDQNAGNCYVAMNAASSPSSFSFIMLPFHFYNMDAPIYQGAISAYCTSSGNLLITEY